MPDQKGCPRNDEGGSDDVPSVPPSCVKRILPPYDPRHTDARVVLRDHRTHPFKLGGGYFFLEENRSGSVLVMGGVVHRELRLLQPLDNLVQCLCLPVGDEYSVIHRIPFLLMAPGSRWCSILSGETPVNCMAVVRGWMSAGASATVATLPLTLFRTISWRSGRFTSVDGFKCITPPPLRTMYPSTPS